MLSRLFAPLIFVCAATSATAEIAPRFEALFKVLSINETVEIMRNEGLTYGSTLRDDLFPGRGGEAWDSEVDRIYAYDAMLEEVREGLARSLQDADVEAITAYFQTDLGREIIELELAARRELADAEVEARAQVFYRDMVLEQDSRIDLLEEFVIANDLVEANVVGAMNSNFAFYKGLAKGKAEGFQISEAEMLEDVWSQEQDIRNETSDWIYGYLVMAYGPLKDEEVQAYVAFSRTEEGRAVNQALFDAFDPMFVEISFQLGLAAARYMAGNEI